jgi:hypothetical protein
VLDLLKQELERMVRLLSKEEKDTNPELIVRLQGIIKVLSRQRQG